MSESEETVSRVTPDYLVVAEHPDGTTSTEHMGSLKDLAKWVIDVCDYFLSNDTMEDLDDTLTATSAANVEFGESKATQLTVLHVKPAE